MVEEARIIINSYRVLSPVTGRDDLPRRTAMCLPLKNDFNDFAPISDGKIDSRPVLRDIYERVLSCSEIMWASE